MATEYLWVWTVGQTKKRKKRKVGGFRMGFVMSIFHKFLKFYRPNDQENKSNKIDHS